MNDKDPKLDRMLGQWADSRAADEARLEHLHGEIAALLEDETTNVELAGLDRAPRRRLVAAFSAVAAAALLAVGLIWFNRTDVEPIAIGNPNETEPAFSGFLAGELSHKAKLLAELEQAFEQRMSWFAESGNDVELGLGDDPTVPNSDSLAVRLVVTKRTGTSSWSRVWTVDVVAKNEQVVRFDAKGNNSLSVWAYVLPDNMIALDTDLTIGGAINVHSVSSEVQHSGTPRQVFEAETDGVEYRVFQTAALLEDEVI